jgi:hypothetical protein
MIDADSDFLRRVDDLVAVLLRSTAADPDSAISWRQVASLIATLQIVNEEPPDNGDVRAVLADALQVGASATE